MAKAPAHAPAVQAHALEQPRDELAVHPAHEHSCMTVRDIRARDSSTVTSSLTGIVRTDERTRAEFVALTRPR